MKSAGQPRHRILIVEDHPMTRYGVAQRIRAEVDLEVCGEAEDSPAALEAVRTQRPDLALVDLSLGGKSGLKLVADLHRLHPALPVLVFSMHYETLFAERVLRAGARGYVMKSEGAAKLIEGIRLILRGGVYLSPIMRDRALHPFELGPVESRGENAALLSDWEAKIFDLLGQGLDEDQLSKHLDLEVELVNAHRRRIRDKLHLRSLAAVHRAAKEWRAKSGK